VRLTLDLFRAREELFEKGTRELLALDYVPQPRPDGHQNLLPGISVPDLKDSEADESLP
jgi:hypothetical protein